VDGFFRNWGAPRCYFFFDAGDRKDPAETAGLAFSALGLRTSRLLFF
jgi:hypothetical protein